MALLDLFRRRPPEERNTQIASALGFNGLAYSDANHRSDGLAVVYRCVQARAEALATLPLNLYRRLPGGGRELVENDTLAFLLRDDFHPRWTAFEAREALSAWADISGNSFAHVQTNTAGQVVGIEPLLPGSVSVERLPSDRLRFRHTTEDGGVRVLLQEDVIHLRHRAGDGIWGEGPIQVARESVGLAAAQQEYARGIALNGSRPTGILTVPGSLSDQAMAAVRTAFERRHQGPENAGRLAILDGGWEYKAMGMTMKDAEFVESRRLSNLDLARLFGVPPTVAGIPDHATYSNVTQENRAFVARCLAPWARRIEAAFNRALLTPTQRQTLFVEHDLSGLLRGDVEARYEAYRIGREVGALSPNDVRARENMPPIEGGDTYSMPANWVRLDAPPEDTGP